MNKILAAIFTLACFHISLAQESANSYVKTLEYRQAASEFESDVDKLSVSNLLTYARILYKLKDYPKALSIYNSALLKGAELSKIDERNMDHCELLNNVDESYNAKGQFFILRLADSIQVKEYCNNSDNEDMSPFYLEGTLYLTTSRRTKINRRQEKYGLTQMPFLNVIALNANCNTENNTSILPDNFNGKFHNGPISISGDKKIIVTTRNYDYINKDEIFSLYLKYFINDGNEWHDAGILPFCKDDYTVEHPCFAKDGRTLYFASNMPGGIGGYDLYSTVFSDTGWSNPTLLGDSINTIYDEVFPFVAPNGDLGYSTNHIEGKGGLDIVLYSGGRRHLLSEPLNGKYDDFGVAFGDTNNLYFTSNRKDGKFNDDLFSVKFLSYEHLLGIEKTPTPVDPTIPVVPTMEVAAVNAVAGTVLLGSTKVYFENDFPKPQGRKKYNVLTNEYMNNAKMYHKSLANQNDEVNQFFEEVSNGYLQLNEIIKKIQSLENVSVTIVLSSYCSPLGEVDYNHQLAERRNAIIKEFIEQHNISTTCNLNFEFEAVGENYGTTSISDDRNNPQLSIYSPDASRLRYTIVTIYVNR